MGLLSTSCATAVLLGSSLGVLPVQGTRNGMVASWNRTHGTNSVKHSDGRFSSHREPFSFPELTGLSGSSRGEPKSRHEMIFKR